MIQSGKPFGEAAMRLQELAILSPKAREKMEDLQKTGATAAEVFGALQTELGKFNGAMLKQSETFGGLSSTLSDIMKLDLGYIFEPLFESTKKAMKALIAFADTPAWQKIKDAARDTVGVIAASLDRVTAAFEKDGIRGAMAQMGAEFGAFIDAANNAVTDGQLTSILSRIINGFLRVLSMIDWGQYAGLFSSIFISIIAATDFASLTAELVPILVTAIADIITGALQGIIEWAITDPIGFVTTLAGIFFMPGKWAKAIGTALSKIPLVGWLFGWLVGALNAIGGPIRGAISGFVSGFVNGIKSTILHWFGGASGWLTSAGSAILNGLWNGLKNKWGEVSRWVGSLGDKIKNLKGPLPKDKIMLVQEGTAIMEGLNRGMVSGYATVEATLRGITRNMPKSIGTDINLVASGQSATSTTTIQMGDIHIADKQTADYFFGQLNRNGELARKGLATL
jgi:hypothetical protein